MEIVFDFTSRTSATAGQGEQERLTQLLGCFQAFIGHELPNQLVPIQAFARMLLEQHAGELDAEGRVVLDRLAALTQRADTLARRLAEIGRLLREPASGPPLALDDVVREAIAEVNVLGSPAGIRYDVQDNMPRLAVSRRLLHEVLVQLLRNAGAAMAAVPGAVVIGGQREPGGVSLWVRDRGRGLTERQVALFEPFAAGRFPGASGPGLGLFFVRQAVARWGGVLRVQSEVDRGSTFTLFIPDIEAGSR
jgi:signal transduction histidine kinase